MRITLPKWKALVESKGFKDISQELPGGFLMFGQWMRAKVVVNGKTYLASGWRAPNDKPFVELVKVKR